MRLFISVNLPEEIREKLAFLTQTLNKSISGSLTHDSNFHITLKFLGETSKIEEIKQACSEAVKNIKPFKATLNTVGAFPSKSAPRIVWAGIDSNNKLKSLQKSIDVATETLGFNKSDVFKEHITLARVNHIKNHYELAKFFKTKISEDIIINSIALMQSKLAKPHAVHEIVEEFDFGA